MKNANYALRKVYNAALAGITYSATAVTAYSPVAPTVTADNYITFDTITATDKSTINSNDSQNSVRVTVHTRANRNNAGLAADTIANSVLQAIYPTPRAVLDMSADSLQMCSTRLESMNKLENIVGQVHYIDVVMIFTHHISHGIS